MEFLTSGVLKFKKEAAIDAFLVGGGGGGGSGKYASGSYSGGGGGGGGYTETLLNIVPRANTEYSIVIGAGGTSALKGGDTSAFGKIVSGGAGGGIASTAKNGGAGGNGGSGIVCFREEQGLPELAGTWVLNDKLYAPENSIPMFQLNYQAGDGAKYYNYKDIAVTTAQFYGNRSNGDYNQFYQFSSNKWSYKYKYFTFPAGATASDEFRAWLASNTTKQTA